MGIKRKASTLEEIEFPISPQAPSAASLPSLTSSPGSISTSSPYSVHSASSPRLMFYQPRVHAQNNTTPAYLDVRTQKRFRDNRPSQETIHEKTLHKLFDAQRRLDDPSNSNWLHDQNHSSGNKSWSNVEISSRDNCDDNADEEMDNEYPLTGEPLEYHPQDAMSCVTHLQPERNQKTIDSFFYMGGKRTSQQPQHATVNGVKPRLQHEQTQPAGPVETTHSSLNTSPDLERNQRTLDSFFGTSTPQTEHAHPLDQSLDFQHRHPTETNLHFSEPQTQQYVPSTTPIPSLFSYSMMNMPIWNDTEMVDIVMS